jgi:hypothetical protein
MSKLPRNQPPGGPQKPRSKNLFNRRAIQRALRSVREAGESIVAIEVTPTGTIRIVVDNVKPPAGAAP